MHDNHHETSPESLRRRHEQSDLSAKSIVTFLAFLTLATGFAAFMMVLLFWYFQEQETRNDRPPSPLALQDTRPPEPRLQALPSIDLERMRKEDAVRLNTYGWVRKEAQVVRVPVEQGMQMLLKRGLPAFPILPQEAAAAAPLTDATQAPVPVAPETTARETTPSDAPPSPPVESSVSAPTQEISPVESATPSVPGGDGLSSPTDPANASGSAP